MTQTAIKYARALWEVNIPDETIDQMMEQYHQTPELQQVLENPVIITYICLIKNPLFEAGFCIEQDIEGASCSPRHSL